MYPSFDAFEYVDYLRRRWRVLAVATSVALLLSLSISLLIHKQYTATASIVIEPPGGNDPRLSTAVSPMYLESLKMFEGFAGSNSLFANTVDHFHLLEPGRSQSIEAFKRRVLKVHKLKDTKILEISATLRDPKLAQQVAQFIAEQTVSTNRKQSLASDQDFAEQAEKQVTDAQRHLVELQQEWNKVATSQPVESLESEIEADVDLKSKVQEQLGDAQAQAAEYEQQLANGGEFAREQLQAARARAAVLEKRAQILERAVTEKSTALAIRTAQRMALQSELKVAQTSYESVSARLREYRASAGTHAEQLRIIDPGIIPEQPSSPNIFLNVAVAVFLAFVAAIVYLSFAFLYRGRRVGFETPVTRGMRA